MLKNRNIILGVTGSIACYKAVEIASRLKKEGANVYVVMTEAATKFVSPLTFRTITANPVRYELFPKDQEVHIPHISLTESADIMVIAPADANIIAKAASGIADDLLSTMLVAVNTPVLFAPAMNVRMYENRIVQENIKKLKSFGYKFVEPEEGILACGKEGKGRLAEVEKIVEEVKNLLVEKKDLQNLSFLVTAGCTQEPIDPIRFISNYSSGKMGYAIAEEANRRGGKVVLVSGPTSISPPFNVKTIYVKTAEEMRREVLRNFKKSDVVIMAAAVVDFRPKNVSYSKIKKKEFFTLELEKTPDILLELGKLKNDKILVGFSAETENLIENAKRKLQEKNLDFIVANDITKKGSRMGDDTNIVKIIHRDGSILSYPKMHKKEVAEKILDQVKKIIEIKGGKYEKK